MRLDGKVAVITGGSRGLGEAMCCLFAQEGAQVICVDVGQMTYSHPQVAFRSLDVTDSAACREFYNETMRQYGKIDILVNNAGITRDAMTRKMSDEMWNQVISVDLTGVFNLTRLIGPQMEEKGSGAIVNISSVVGEYGNIGQANYAAAKAGVMGLTKTWAKEFARKGAAVRVNCITPGYTLTDMLKTIPQDLLDSFAAKTMLGRLGQPIEIANAALFLASDEASYITGQVLAVNGGMRL